MLKHQNEYTHEVRESMKGGNGSAEFEHIWAKGTEMHSKTRLFSRIILEPGCSIGYHVHENEEEIFLILEGCAKANDNGEEITLQTGDSMITRSGEGHSIENPGKTRLVILAAVICY